ncbi:hypothetical protein [Clostridium sp. DL-VIII]|uniref:hypothetical protein n=1 Tax=Clostridium sp. DL-VIII TaxID=641107 RepID=UPI00163F8C43|nr:hypothetical protein [Clostridium sp. DL-VIII]
MEKEIESKDKEIYDLKKQLSFLKGQILNKNRKIFDNLVNKLIQDSSHFLMMPKKTVILK